MTTFLHAEKRLASRGGLLAVLPFLLLETLGVASSVHAFARTMLSSGAVVYWGEGQVGLNLRFGCPDLPLSTWGPCWDDAAADALHQWNVAAVKFRFAYSVPAPPTDPCAHTDRVNTATFASSICGMGFGSALAVTFVVSNSTTGELIDADTLVDSSRRWSTYEGALQRDPSTGAVSVYDFHRVVMHEFGHTLGLGHPDTAGQTVFALMNSRISDLDSLQTDDIAGVNAIYPAQEPPSDASLENPQPGDFVSGVNLISGWACAAQQIEIQIDNFPPQLAAYGTPRADTLPVCGDANNGFGFLINWANLGDGVHLIIARKDGIEFARRTFIVTTLGTDFLRGARGRYLLPNFNGQNLVIEWKESLQNFVIIDRQ
ncbi:MAG TPA: matrixin family metalloprotease [Methylomirabilota bacterium]|nr:matrixin family metalloprotease [Methylomirabilota bacterium]